MQEEKILKMKSDQVKKRIYISQIRNDLYVVQTILYNNLSSDCNATYSGMSGLLLSPLYPNNYQNSMFCEINVDVPVNHTIMLEFSDFNTEGCCDGLQVKYIFISSYV